MQADPKNEGNFVLIENGKTFWFEPTSNDWARAHGATHDLILINGAERRPVRILQTVVHRIVDEGPDGAPVWGESWKIRALRQWEKK